MYGNFFLMVFCNPCPNLAQVSIGDTAESTWVLIWCFCIRAFATPWVPRSMAIDKQFNNLSTQHSYKQCITIYRQVSSFSDYRLHTALNHIVMERHDCRLLRFCVRKHKLHTSLEFCFLTTLSVALLPAYLSSMSMPSSSAVHTTDCILHPAARIDFELHVRLLWEAGRRDEAEAL